MIKEHERDRKSTRLNSSHSQISYAVFCLKKTTRVNRILRRNGNYGPRERGRRQSCAQLNLSPTTRLHLFLRPTATPSLLQFFFLNNPAPTNTSPLPPSAPLPT